MNINKVILIGRLGNDVEIKMFEAKEGKDARGVAKMSVATTESRKVGDEWVDNTEWHNVIVWGSQKYMDSLQKRMTKGRLVYVEGKLTHRSYTDANENVKYITEVECSNGVIRNMDKAGGSTTMPDASDDPATKKAGKGKKATTSTKKEGDDLPF